MPMSKRWRAWADSVIVNRPLDHLTTVCGGIPPSIRGPRNTVGVSSCSHASTTFSADSTVTIRCVSWKKLRRKSGLPQVL